MEVVRKKTSGIKYSAPTFEVPEPCIGDEVYIDKQRWCSDGTGAVGRLTSITDIVLDSNGMPFITTEAAPNTCYSWHALYLRQKALSRRTSEQKYKIEEAYY